LTGLTWRQVRSRRLRRSLLATRSPNHDLVEAVRAVCGIQAQVAAAGELALAARVARVTRPQVRAALWDTRTLAKAWTVRGTLHLHPADELGTWLAARRGTREWTEGRWRAREGLSARESRRLMDAITDALDGRSLTRTALGDEVRRRVGSRVADRIETGWAHLLGPAATAGILCHGPPQGSSATFVRPDQWLGARPRPDPAEALQEVARRFVATYGPTTPRRFREWFYLDQDEAEGVFRSLAPELVTVEVEGNQTYLPAGEAADRSAARSVRLLPAYDCYVMGFRERDQLVSAAARVRARQHPRGRFEGAAPVPWLLVDGVVAGTWARRRSGGEARVEVDPLEPPAATLAEAVERERGLVCRFLAS
jgi:hypothetical protein